ncbi:MAG: hypothetical protein DCF15_06600 [Phormidesmis priestleyi]|uniref:Protein kinase domain-containing protein n=1 Tax=Phormidesmis priestleyi TaxID=268141 RepID=A0A2W4XNS8_9CYAN|nr:MAG: hypothetical protein DCF15_06600 [Phormidesmis priestleyi]
MAYCFNPDCPDPQTPDPQMPDQQTSVSTSLPVAKFCGHCGTPLTLAGRYQMIELLGQGGFGRTFLAQQLSTETNAAAVRCVIKQLYPQASSAEVSFQAETARLKKLGEHPQIPALLDAIENEYGQFWVQALAVGSHLAAQVEKAGPWNETQVRSLLKSLIPVLQYVHSFDIIHRDIKPANIVLADPATQRGKPLPMLVDFGSAKWVRRHPATTVIGSADYAAPEQSMGQATFASDIYSLGVSCLYALTGISPFSLYSAVEDDWVWRDFLPQPIEPRFAQVLDQMVARSLQQRYESMDQVALDLQFSQNLLRYAPKQLLSKAKDLSVPLRSLNPFKKTNLLQPLQALRKSLQPSALSSQPAPVIVSAPQVWQRRDRLTRPIGVTQALAISPSADPSRSIFATGGTDGALRLWHLPSAQLIHTFHRRRLIGDGHSDTITALHFHPDGRALYSASSDGSIKEWDSAEHSLLNTLPTGGWTPTALSVTADGAQLISPNTDGQIVLWDIATLMPVAQLAQHQRRVNAVALSERGDLLASASDDGTVKLWRYRRGAPQLAKTISLQHKREERRAIALALHNNSSGNTSATTVELIVADSAGTVQIYPLDAELNPGQATLLHASPSPITALALSADGTLAIGTEDPIVTLWRVDTGDCVAELAHDWGMVAMAFCRDGQTLIAASADEVISIWQKAA